MESFTKIKRKLRRKTVGIAGAGGLGSNCAVALARVGIGKLIICDFDKVTRANLNRQYYFNEQIGQQKVFALADNIFFIDPYVKVLPKNIKLSPANIKESFKSCDVIVEAFDKAEMKEMLIETVLDEMPEKPLVVGLGMAGWGKNEIIKSRNIDNLFICGDEETEISPELPPLAPRVGIVANMQANQVLELLLNQ
ncbi:MAG TPA: sulfur carrier protein ThiS adenylyltransferase ThiF [Bacteroidales bacterium]|nr:sulfur carrier protein ThiS adenylyltransferase ThiF [Bacteroidales bacterium]HPE58097.1 sulfur carrier protein ThiS adenylyltransferase ThiF [Bacteroidales bacterium]HRX96446.1 sulfur carrier protein ThiS adenylyltransferase ThiF [Bacteroidales bacterium]